MYRIHVISLVLLLSAFLELKMTQVKHTLEVITLGLLLSAFLELNMSQVKHT